MPSCLEIRDLEMTDKLCSTQYQGADIYRFRTVAENLSDLSLRPGIPSGFIQASNNNSAKTFVNKNRLTLLKGIVTDHWALNNYKALDCIVDGEVLYSAIIG